MKTTKLTILNMIFTTALGFGFSAHAGNSQLIMSCSTSSNVDSGQLLQFFVDESGQTDLVLKLSTGEIVGYDQSLDYSGGYVLRVEGAFMGRRYHFNKSSGRLEDNKASGFIKSFICK